MSRIVIADDDPNIGRILRDRLAEHWGILSFGMKIVIEGNAHLGQDRKRHQSAGDCARVGWQ